MILHFNKHRNTNNLKEEEENNSSEEPTTNEEGNAPSNEENGNSQSEENTNETNNQVEEPNTNGEQGNTNNPTEGESTKENETPVNENGEVKQNEDIKVINNPSIIIERIDALDGIETSELSNNNDLQYYSVKSVNGNKTSLNGAIINVTKKVDSEKYQRFVVYKVEDDGTLTEVETKVNDNNEIEFAIDELGEIVIASELKNAIKKSTIAKGNLLPILGVMGGIVLIEMLAVRGLSRKIRKQKKLAKGE